MLLLCTMYGDLPPPFAIHDNLVWRVLIISALAIDCVFDLLQPFISASNRLHPLPIPDMKNTSPSLVPGHSFSGTTVRGSKLEQR